MESLKRRIFEEGRVAGRDILIVDSFLNHQMDVRLLDEVGKEFHRLFKEEGITRILTVEASGISVACMAARYFDVPAVFAKKTESRNLDSDTYESEVHSFTKGITYKIRVSKKYLLPGDRVLILDDFLANGRAVMGLKDVTEQAGAILAGVGIVIEKHFQEGGRMLRKMGVNLHSLAVVASLEGGRIKLL